MIKLVKVTKSFRQQRRNFVVLQDINLEVNAGEVFGIIGKSGAGKSTLLKCLNLLERPDAGAVIVDGVDLTSLNLRQLRALRRQIGVIFQHFNLLNSKTIFDNVALPLVLQGDLSRAEIKVKVDEILELVGLSALAHQYPARLSGGQKQRVGIARALITNPKLLLCDEATSALDPETTTSILELLLTINQRLGITMILITHELDVVRKVCDKVAVIDGGQIIEQGDAFNILLHPKHPVTRKLIIEEDSEKYLEQIQQFYRFDKHNGKHLLLLSFVGEKTYTPILNLISRGANVEFSILRGELGRIKHMPFGQLLVEFEGAEDSLKRVTAIMDEQNVHYEIVR